MLIDLRPDHVKEILKNQRKIFTQFFQHILLIQIRFLIQKVVTFSLKRRHRNYAEIFFAQKKAQKLRGDFLHRGVENSTLRDEMG